MAREDARGLAHLVGSVPLESAEAVFRTVLGALGPHLSRVPDGETGARRRWVYWQRTMLENHPAMEVDGEADLLELRQWDGSLLRRAELLRFKAGVDPDSVDFPIGYAEAAVASWRLFGVATECGWGRGDPVRLEGLLESHRNAVAYLRNALPSRGVS